MCASATVRGARDLLTYPVTSSAYTASTYASQWLAAQGTLHFDWALGGTTLPYRQLRITPLAALDGTHAAVALVGAAGQSGSVECFYCTPWEYDDRVITAGSLVLTLLPAPVAIVQVDEFHNASLQHYFITANAAEKNDLDTGVRPGWTRTGQSFKAYVAGSSAGGAINPVCRYFSNSSSSHFHSANAAECLAVHEQFSKAWIYESDNVFQIDVPDMTTGVCPGTTLPVYRLWNNRVDSNHRYTTRAAIKAEMLAAGYVAEGYGADSVVMCAVQ